MLDHPRETDWAFLCLDSASWWRIFLVFPHVCNEGKGQKRNIASIGWSRSSGLQKTSCQRKEAEYANVNVQRSKWNQQFEEVRALLRDFLCCIAFQCQGPAPLAWSNNIKQFIEWVHCILHLQKSCWTHHNNRWCKVESVSISSSLQWGPEVVCTSTSRHTSAFGLCATSGSNLCPCGPCMTKLVVCEASWRGHVFWSLAADSAPIGVHIGASKVIGPFHADQNWEPASPSPPDKAKVTWNALRDPCTSHPARSRHFAASLSRSLTRWNAQNVLSPSVAATRHGFLPPFGHHLGQLAHRQDWLGSSFGYSSRVDVNDRFCFQLIW